MAEDFDSDEEARHIGMDISKWVAEVEGDKIEHTEIFITGESNNLNLELPLSFYTVDSIEEYITRMSRWLEENKVKAWQTGTCNTLLVSRLNLNEGTTLDSIGTSMIRTTLSYSGYLKHIWASPYQLSANFPIKICMVDDVQAIAKREDIFIRIDFQAAFRFNELNDVSLAAGWARNLYALTFAKNNAMGRDLALGILTVVNALTTYVERQQMKAELNSSYWQRFMSWLKNSDFELVHYLIHEFERLASERTQSENQNALFDDSAFAKVLSNIQSNEDLQPNLMQQFTEPVARTISQEVVDVNCFSRDTLTLVAIAYDDDLLTATNFQEKHLELIDDELEKAPTSDTENLHRASESLTINGNTVNLAAGDNIDHSRFMHEVKPSRKAVMRTTCNGVPSRVGIEGNTPWLYGLDIGTIMSILRWGAERFKGIRGNPQPDMVDTRNVRGRTVLSLLFSGVLGPKGTAWLMSNILHGDIKLNENSKNSLVKAIAKFKNDGEGGYKIDTLASSRFTNQLNALTSDGVLYLLVGQDIVAKVTGRGSFNYVEEVGVFTGEVSAAGRAMLTRPIGIVEERSILARIFRQ